MEWTRKLGLTYWESYNGHLPLTDDSGKIAGYKEKLASAGIQIMAYGVVGFGADKAKNRAVFEFAKAMGIAVLSADPKPEAFDDLDQLVEEFGIHIAIHNHGPGHPYDKIKNVEDAIKGRHERIGSCVDTGHYLRSKEDPVDAIRRLGKRVYAVHLKDVRSAKTFTVVGDGDLDVPGVLRELKKLKYSQCLALEYEENPDNPIADIRRSLAHVQKAVKKVAGK
ncbi:MAG: sugar phosphate isomerase/epimerase [Planctomycetes bacterium]|nr:sugar phosphate isomerase/epimerase [Planctomycetota bacterium]